MKKLILFFGILPMFCAAQLKIMDLNVLPLAPGGTFGNDSVQVLVQIKISNPALSQSIHFQFGSLPDVGDVINGIAPIIQIGTDYFVSYDGKQEKVNNHDTRIYCKMSMIEYNAWQHITVFAEAISGNNSEHLYQTR